MKIYRKTIEVSILNGIQESERQWEEGYWIPTGSFSSIATLVTSPISGKPEWVEFNLPWTRDAIKALECQVFTRYPNGYESLIPDKLGSDRIWLRAGSDCKTACGPIEAVNPENGTITLGQPISMQGVEFPTIRGWEHPGGDTWNLCLLEGAYRSIIDDGSDVSIVSWDDNPEIYSTTGESKWVEYVNRRNDEMMQVIPGE